MREAIGALGEAATHCYLQETMALATLAPPDWTASDWRDQQSRLETEVTTVEPLDDEPCLPVA